MGVLFVIQVQHNLLKVCILFYYVMRYNGIMRRVRMNDRFDVVKSELNAVVEVEDIWKHPCVQALYAGIKLIPPIGNAIESAITNKLADFQKKKQRELCEIIFDDDSITLDDVQDVEVVMEFARMYDVVNRLASNEKVQYIANLFKKTFSNKEEFHNHLSEYEEYLGRLEHISIRELDLLFLLYKCEQSPELRNKKSATKIEEIWDLFKREAKEQLNVDGNIIVSMMSGLTMTGFCQEANIMFPDGENENPFYTTAYFKRFLELIS